MDVFGFPGMACFGREEMSVRPPLAVQAQANHGNDGSHFHSNIGRLILAEQPDLKSLLVVLSLSLRKAEDPQAPTSQTLCQTISHPPDRPAPPALRCRSPAAVPRLSLCCWSAPPARYTAPQSASPGAHGRSIRTVTLVSAALDQKARSSPRESCVRCTKRRPPTPSPYCPRRTVYPTTAAPHATQLSINHRDTK